MTYARVIPRDLFNESKLLKCLGQLALIIHDKPLPCPLALEHENPKDGFVIAQDKTTGNLYCTSLSLVLVETGDTVDVFTIYNSKAPFPLYFDDGNNSEFSVFEDDGTLSTEFTEFLASKAAEKTCETCGETLDQDCMGEMRCLECDGPCPHCYDGGGPGADDDEEESDDVD